MDFNDGLRMVLGGGMQYMCSMNLNYILRMVMGDRMKWESSMDFINDESQNGFGRKNAVIMFN